MDTEFIKRFRAKYSINKDSGCWEWTASLAGRGYGQIKIPKTRKQAYAHRVSWEIHYGEIPEGKSVLHRCDNPKCVNPEHLFIGSSKDNAQDMKSKKRHLYGERNTEAVLTEADVKAIKLLLDSGVMSQSKIGALFGVHQMTISKIKRGLRWAYIK